MAINIIISNFSKNCVFHMVNLGANNFLKICSYMLTDVYIFICCCSEETSKYIIA